MELEANYFKKLQNSFIAMKFLVSSGFRQVYGIGAEYWNLWEAAGVSQFFVMKKENIKTNFIGGRKQGHFKSKQSCLGEKKKIKVKTIPFIKIDNMWGNSQADYMKFDLEVWKRKNFRVLRIIPMMTVKGYCPNY